MKPALVLGLALAANAMVPDQGDNEFFVAPTGKLAEFAKRHPQIMFDEQANDELAVKYVHLPHIPAPEYVAYDDDELLIRPLVPHIAADDAADDEFAAVLLTRDYFKTEEEYLFYRARARISWDDAADDELRIRPISVLPTAEHVAFDDDELMRGIPPVENFKSYEDWLRFTRRMSEEVDDELLVQPVQDLSRYRTDVFGKILKDGIGRPLPPVLARFDEVTDDELRIRPISVLPTAEPVAFDDEFSFMPIPPKVFVNRDWVKPAKIPVSEALIRDDEADDELAYLGQLINDRPFARTFDDDELRAEKPSHLKAQEMTQMKSELPKMKRKFRPIIDEVPLTQN